MHEAQGACSCAEPMISGQGRLGQSSGFCDASRVNHSCPIISQLIGSLMQDRKLLLHFWSQFPVQRSRLEPRPSILHHTLQARRLVHGTW